MAPPPPPLPFMLPLAFAFSIFGLTQNKLMKFSQWLLFNIPVLASSCTSSIVLVKHCAHLPRFFQ